MNLTYFKADIGNFGDDLNLWLWPKLLGDFNLYPENLDFVGVGSILDERILTNSEAKKIVFGSGVRDVNFKIKPEDNVDIQFVRGPISSKIMGDKKFISDAAYALRLLDYEIIPEKKYKTSYIPYFRNYLNFNWKLFEKISGIHVINPTAHIEDVITEINASETIYTSAMHGAILSDIYRIPWMRVRFNKTGLESNFTSELKWQDWLRTINKSEIPIIDFDFNLNQPFSQLTSTIKLIKVIKKLKNTTLFTLSTDSIITEIEEKINDEVNLFINNYKSQ